MFSQFLSSNMQYTLIHYESKFSFTAAFLHNMEVFKSYLIAPN
uniref:Uncharacterized protein n=1 Tax=Anguilla anguilla TaxID=7936 RepID=A0A0E9RPN1_ANGAN